MPIMPEKPRFRGTVNYAPSLGSAPAPVVGARVRIYDIDIGGTDDLLIDVTTNSNGRFDKQAEQKWQADVQMPTGFGSYITLPDITDVPLFVIRVDDPVAGKWLKLPFGYLGDSIDVPVIVSWPQPSPPPGGTTRGGSTPQHPDGLRFIPEILKIIPETLNVLNFNIDLFTVNGATIRSLDGPGMVWTRIKAAADNGEDISIRFAPSLSHIGFPRAADGKPDVARAMRDTQDKMGLPGPMGPAAPMGAIGAVEAGIVIAAITGVVVITFILFVAAPLALAHAGFLVMLGLAILYAVNLGYHVEVVKIDSSSPPSDNSVPIPLSDLHIKLTKPTAT